MKSGLAKVLLYVPAVAGLDIYYMGSTDVSDTTIVVSAAAAYLLLQLLLDESLLASVLNAYLFMGVFGSGGPTVPIHK